MIDIPSFLMGKAMSSGGSSVTVESLSVTENGTYTAEEGKAYSPIEVTVPQTTVESLSVTENGTYTAPTGKAYSPVTVNVGGTVTLQNSGWVQSYDTDSEISGNIVTLKAGSTSHDLRVAPPSIVRGSANFLPGDVLKIAFTVTAVSGRAGLNMANSPNWSATSATGLMTISNGNTYTKTAGSDVLTFTFTASSGSSSYLSFHPSKGSDGSGYASSSASYDVTGMSFNDTLIFGSVTPPSA